MTKQFGSPEPLPVGAMTNSTTPSTSKCCDQSNAGEGPILGCKCPCCFPTTHNQEYCECDVTTTPVAPPDRKCAVCKLPRHNQEEGKYWPLGSKIPIEVTKTTTKFKLADGNTLILHSDGGFQLEIPERNQEESWEKEFDKKFCSLYGVNVHDFSTGSLIMGNPKVDEFKSFISKVHNEAARKFYQMGYDESKSDAIQEERERLAGEIKMAIGIKLEKTPITPDDPAKEYLSKAHVLFLIRTNTTGV